MIETLQFKVGADMGLRLMEISNEHLLYNNDLDKAINVFQQSFGGGCPEDILLKLLTGDMVVSVNVETQEFIVSDREAHHDAIYPAKIDWYDFFKKKEEEIESTCENFMKGFDNLVDKFRYKDYYDIQFTSEAVMKFIYGSDKDLIEEIRDDFELNGMVTFIKVVKDFIEQSMKIQTLSNRVKALYPRRTDSVVNYVRVVEFDTFELMSLIKKVQDVARMDFSSFLVEEDYSDVTAYLEASKEIDTVISDGIEPVDIMNNYSAGWLSPEGEYYALNGAIANMLHNQIADALQEKGLIPLYETKEGERYFFKNQMDKPETREISPDAWLEQQGWVKIHGNNINFGGCLNVKIDKPNVNMTDIQIDMIRDYINDCHQCIMRAGWRLIKESVNRFAVLAKSDPIALNKKYFTFD